jgi:hypothetical protein
MSSSIRLRRSAEPGKIPSSTQLQLGELAINTHDGKIFLKRDQNGLATIRQIGARDDSDNVYYVAINGSDTNDGKTIGDAFATLHYALSVVPEGSTIHLKSGTHVVNNPVVVPPFVAIVGDSLRTSIVKAKNKKKDIFWVRNGAFIKDIRITGHEAPAAGVAFPVGGKEAIYTSPYVQNCTSDTSTGTGMRIDGNHATGLKSMVVDAYTQYNQGGIGIHHLNGGNTQLVSVFTICCDIAILCESGGFCSLTNSNSSFGNKGLVSDGLSQVLYNGSTGIVQTNNSLIINDLKNIPYLQNSVKFSGGPEYYTVLDATPLKVGEGVIVEPDFSVESSALNTARITVKAEKSVLQKATIDFINSTYPSLKYNQSKCFRDVGIIIDAAIDDMVFNTNYKTVVAARSYYRQSAGLVIGGQKTETLAAIAFVRDEVLDLLTPATTEYTRVEANFNTVIDVITNGLGNLPTITFPNPTGVFAEVVRAKNHLINNKAFLTAEAIAFIAQNYPDIGYDRDLCERDVGLIIDALGYDLMFGSNFRTITAGRSYYRKGSEVVIESQKVATIAAYNLLKDLAVDLVADPLAVTSIQNNVDLLVSIIDEGLTAVPNFVLPEPTDYNTTYLVGYGDARNLIEANREFIKAEVDKYIEVNYSDVYATFDKVACQRDLDYILDAVRYDMTYGGNMESIIAGNAYYSGNALQLGLNEKPATLAAYDFLKDLIIDVAQNIDVTELQSVVAQVTGVAGTEAAALAAGDLIDDIITIINNPATPPATVNASTTWVSAALVSDNAALQAAKSTIQNDITEFLEANYAYNQETCERDVGYIIDGVIYDILYRGNTQSYAAGIAYYANGVSQIPERQLTATSEVFGYFAVKVSDIFRANAVLSLQSVVPQDTSEVSATLLEINRANTLFGIVQSVIKKGYFISSFIEVIPQDFASQTELSLDIRDMILENKNRLQFDTIEFINKNFSEFEYNEEICSRDVGFILESVAMDVALGTNYNAVIAGLSYQRANLAINRVKSTQFVQTLNAVKFVKDETLKLNLSTAGATRVAAAFDTIIDIFQGETPPTLTFPEPTLVDLDLASAKDQLLANKEFIKAEVIAYINDEFQGFTYDQAKCERDLGLILDAILLDTVLNSNYNSIVAGESYYRANASDVIGLQKIQTLGALNYFKSLIETLETISGAPRVRLLNRISLVVEIVETGVVGRTFENSAPVGVAATLVNADSLLRNNRLFLQKEVIAYVEQEYPSLVYDVEKCERDVGFVVDALRHDILYGGTFATQNAAKSYFVGATSQLGAGEEAATIAAYQHLKLVIESVVTGVLIIRTPGNTENQSLSTSVATSTEAGVLNNLIDLVITVIIDDSTLPAVVLPDYSWADQTFITLYNTVNAKRTDFINATIQFINLQYSSFTYDQDKCSRDLSLIVDALALDAALGTNYNSITAGNSYYRANASEVVGSQKEATLAALQYFRELIIHQSTVLIEFKNILLGLLDEIINIVDTGTQTLILTYNTPGNATPAQIAAKDRLIANKEFIKDEIIAYINANDPPVGYDDEKCERDVGLIVDGLAHDILYGTNYATIQVANSYFVGTTSQLGAGETAATIAAYEYLQSVVSNVIQNVVVTPTGGHSVNVQDTVGEAATAAEATVLTNLIAVIVTVITDGEVDDSSIVVFPSLTWTTNIIQKEFMDFRAEKEKFISSTISYINRTFLGFDYNEEKCARDVGYIVEALAYDILYGGNSASRRVALSYFSQFEGDRNINQLGAGETQFTIQAYQHLTNVVSSIVQGIAVTPSISNDLTQDTMSSNATDVEAAKLATLLNIIIKVLEIGTANNVVNEVFPSVTWADVDYQNDLNAIRTNKKLIQSGTIGFINDRYVDFNYEEAKCSRDVGLILEAVLDDMVFDTNYKSIIAGSSYYRMSASKVINEQLLETIEAIKYLKTSTLSIISSYSAGTQYAAVSARFDDIIDILTNGVETLPAIEFNTPLGATVEQENAVALLQANKDFFVEEATAFINDNFPMLGYDRDLCERDVGLIIDALGYDLMFGSNFRTITAGRSYYRKGSEVVIESQKVATVAAYALLRDLAANIVSSPVAKLSVRNNMNLLINIINNGLSAVPAFVLPDPVGYSVGFRDARDLIEDNRAFVKAEVIEFISQNYSDEVTAASSTGNVFTITDTTWMQVGNAVVFAGTTFGGVDDETTYYVESIPSGTTFTVSLTSGGSALTLTDDTGSMTVSLAYDVVACQRDLDYILDAVRYDMTYGGNMESIIAGNAYYSGNALQLGTGEKAATLAAYGFLKDLIIDVAQNIDVTELQSVVAQVTGVAGTLAAANAAGGLIQDIITIIDTPLAPPSTVNASTAWVSAALVSDNAALQAAKSTIQTQLTEFIEANHAYKEAVCRRDVGFIIDAVCYDILYSGNTQMTHASNEYYSGNNLQIPEFTVLATRKTYEYLRSIAKDVVLTVSIPALQTIETQVTNLDPTNTEVVTQLDNKFKILVNLLTHGYSSIITFDTRIRRKPLLNESVEFYQPSLITASGHTFEWVGAGTNINSALPSVGGQPIEENQVLELNNGKVYFTSTDQKGDFKIGPELTIERASGTITGEAFDRSLFAVLTPYILSLQ